MNEDELERSSAAAAVRAALRAPQPASVDNAVTSVVHRAQNETAVRDVMSLGFVHLLGSVLAVLATVFRLVQAPPSDPAGKPTDAG